MIPRTKVNYSARDLAVAASVVDTAYVQRQRLVEHLRAYFGVEHVVLTPSGRAGLYAILAATQRPRVIIPAYTCKAVVEAATLAGKKVVYAPVEEDGFNLDSDQLGPLVDERSIVLATHQFGIPCDIDKIARICRREGAMLVEDAAASLGSRVGGQLTGTFGEAAFFSFDSTKLVNVPLKAGFVLAKDGLLCERIERMHRAAVSPMPLTVKAKFLSLGAAMLAIENPTAYRAFHFLNFDLRGRFTADSPRLHFERVPFYAYDIAEWQAFLAAEQVRRIDALINRRQRLYRELRAGLFGCQSFVLPPQDVDNAWACIRFPIRVRLDKLVFYRHALARGVDFAFSFTFVAAPKRFGRAHHLARSVLDLPFYDKLSSRELDETVAVLRQLDDQFR